MRQSIVGSVLLAALFFTFSNTSHALPENLLQCSTTRDLTRVLELARTMVAAIPVEHSEETTSYREYLRGASGPYPLPPTTDYQWRTISLALLHPSTGELRTTVVTRRIENGRLPIVLVSNDEKFLFAIESRPSGTTWNWWNTQFVVLAPQGWVVVADHWKRHPSGVSMVYTPFSVALATTFPELSALGEQHVEDDIATALALLRHVPSRADTTKSVSEMLEERLPDLARAVISVEHADPYDVHVYQRDGGAFNPLKRAFIIFGANGNEAFNATRSSAGAQGLMQVMPETWDAVRDRYPSARLPLRSQLPEHSHPVEVVAGLLTADYHLSLLAVYAKRRGISLEELLLRSDLQSLALASFNGGPGRVGAQLKNPQWRTRLHPETQGYLAKFDRWAR